jgi:hypothetical protein
LNNHLFFRELDELIVEEEEIVEGEIVEEELEIVEQELDLHLRSGSLSAGACRRPSAFNLSIRMLI